MRTVHVFVEGRVQGVWYRGWTACEAVSLSLSGWVRNLLDGRVEAVFSGDITDVDVMLKKVHAGPPLSRVDAVHIEDIETPILNGFEKRPTA